MDSLIPYIAFPGTCREAMAFYSDVLNGEITMMQTFSESPVDVPEAMGHRVFNAEVIAQGIRIKASDDLPGHEVKMGTHISLYVVFSDQAVRKTVFEKLSEGGKVQFPLDEHFGMLKDKYGIQWMLVHEHPS